MKKESGNVGEILVTGMSVLAMTVIMMAFLKSVGLLEKKAEVSNVCRKYLLVMETKGYLNGDDEAELKRELTNLGLSDIDLKNTTRSRVSYGDEITLSLSAVFTEGGEQINEKRSSTAKY